MSDCEIKCTICSKQFTTHRGLSRHFKGAHQTRGSNQISEKFTCADCGGSFTKKCNLIRHITRRHSKTDGSKSMPVLKCIMCTFECEKKEMVNHYSSTHNINISTTTVAFKNFLEFEKWKMEMEKETISKYIKYRAKRTNEKVIHFYRCHRDGFFKKSGKNIRHLKLLGSNKINGHCPARLDVTVLNKSGCVSVKYIKTHVGHDMDLRRLTLTKKEKEQIADKIGQKMPFDEILNVVRDNVSKDNLERIHLLTKKDLFNIKKIYNLQNDSVTHSIDSIGLEGWITEMTDSVVRLYKRQGQLDPNFPELEEQDFLLVIMNDAQLEILKKCAEECVCVDATHGSNPYNFELTTLLVIDEMREGFPCMFVFSNRTDVVIFKMVFGLIKSLCVILKPKIFMSDLTEASYSAWVEVMEAVPYRLFCSWHIDDAWRKNIKEKIKNRQKQFYAYKVVRTLMEERDFTTFNKILPQAIIQMQNDPDLEAFASYFSSYYVANREMWAYSYRMHSGLNTNMHLERMHRTIKYIYPKSKVGKRLDKTISAIMKFIKDKLFERVITYDKGNLYYLILFLFLFTDGHK